MHSPMFGFVLLAFLLLAVVLAVAVFFAFKSGQAGTTKLSGPAGCMIALALLVIAGVGGIGLLIVALVSIPNEAVRHGPIKSWEFKWGEGGDESSEDSVPSPDNSTPHVDERELRVTVVMRGLEDPQSVMKWLRQRTDAETHITVREEKDADGKVVTVVDLTVPPDHEVARELREMRKDLERDLPELRLPTGVKIEFRGPEED